MGQNITSVRQKAGRNASSFSNDVSIIYDGAVHLSGNSFMEGFLIRDGERLVVRHYEFEGGATIYNEYEYSSAFDFDAVCARSPGEYYVAGVDSAGNTVIEKWVLTPHNGSQHAVRSAATTAIGVPIPSSTVSQMVVGGQLTPMGTRRANPRSTRTTIYQGTGLAPVVVMNVDPEARFLIVNSQLGEVFQIDLTTTPAGAPNLLYDQSSGLGVDLTQVTGMSRYHDVNDWRIWLFSTHEEIHNGPPGPMWLALIDSDNDGDFHEHAPHVDQGATIATQLIAPSLIVDSFIKGP